MCVVCDAVGSYFCNYLIVLERKPAFAAECAVHMVMRGAIVADEKLQIREAIENQKTRIFCGKKYKRIFSRDKRLTPDSDDNCLQPM